MSDHDPLCPAYDTLMVACMCDLIRQAREQEREWFVAWLKARAERTEKRADTNEAWAIADALLMAVDELEEEQR
jgi:hypothetical protein